MGERVDPQEARVWLAPSPGRVLVEMDIATAQVLKKVLENVGGSMERDEPRHHMHLLDSALSMVGLIASPCTKAWCYGTTGSIHGVNAAGGLYLGRTYPKDMAFGRR